jgi:Nucleotidyl transferase AbiEii toxin, Type IV TA system
MVYSANDRTGENRPVSRQEIAEGPGRSPRPHGRSGDRTVFGSARALRTVRWGTLVLFHERPRISTDLDLLARVDGLPTAQELIGALEARLQEVAGALGLGPVLFEPETKGEHFVRLWILRQGKQKLFTVDLTRIGGSVLVREIVKEKIEEEGKTALIPAASRDYLLFQKGETLVSRRIVKARDAFDIRLLLQRGAKLDATLKGHLEDALKWREVSREEINERIESVNQKLCRAELKPVLPEEVYAELEQDNLKFCGPR